MQGKRHDRVVEMRLCFFSGKVGDYKVPFKSTRKCRSTVGGPEPPKDKTGCYGKWQKHKKYNRHPNSETELVEFLKFAQRGK